MCLKLDQIGLQTAKLAALECQKLYEENAVNTLAATFIIVSNSFMQVTKTTKTIRMTLKFSKIHPGTADSSALEHLKKS